MYTSTIILAIAGLSAAQSLAGIPTCATGCITSALPANCNLDPKCICESSNFLKDIACCISTACDKEGQDAALAYAKTICNPVGVTDLPQAATCAPGSGNGTSSTASGSSSPSSASGTMTPSDTSASPTVSPSSAATSASSAASGSSSAASSATGSAGPAATSSGAGAALYAKSVGLAMGVGFLGAAALL